MSKTAIAVVAGLVVLAIGAFYLSARVSQAPLSDEEDTTIRAMVTEFGTKLQMVPLLAPTAQRKAAMELYYAPYVALELLAAWAPEASVTALGRYSSSPWPERIEIVSVQKVSPTTYQVEGNVIEVATYASSTPVAAVYPVGLTIKKEGPNYRITAARKGAYAVLH